MKTINLIESKEDEKKVNIPDSVGHGHIQIMEIRPGIYIYFEDYKLDEPVRFIYSHEPENQGIIGIGFCLSGHALCEPQLINNTFKFSSGERVFFSFPSGTEFCETIKSKRMLSLTIMITPEFITSCSKEFPELLPDNLPFLVRDIQYNCLRISNFVQNLVNQILSCPFKGICRKFFIEGKVMEILAHLLNEKKDKSSLSKKDSINPHEIANVQRAAEIMKLSQENFQNLESIAKSVGMCRSRFHKCFTLVYGISPFEYQRNFRIETAKSLIVNGGMSITEVAYSVGYSSLSHFAKIFKEYEGVPPSEFKESFQGKLINDSII